MKPYEVSHWFDGKPQRGTGTGSQDIFNPATGQVQGKLLLGGQAELDAAVAMRWAKWPAASTASSSLAASRSC
jgi:malonate-semialdehyde dehydrogenase (acetylating)/methylmalonate-semialdehyde dehydrogenase